MEVKVNMECVIKILEKNGYEIENMKVVKAGSPITASKEVASRDSEKVELFQVRCGPPYMKFEAKIDNNAQKSMIDALNRGLDSLVKGALSLTSKEPK